LTWWASGKALEQLGWTNPKIVPKEEGIKIAGKARKNFFITNADYYDWLQECYKNHATSLKESAEKGTDLHAELEKFVKAEMGIWNYEIEDLDKRILPFVNWAKENVKQFLWSEANCFDEELWVGGISDAGCELKDGRLAVIDFKSSKAAYPTSFLQTAGYAIQIEKNGLFHESGLANKKVEGRFGALIVVPFGAEVVMPEIRYEVEPYKLGFRQAVGLYRLLGMDEKIKENK